MDDAVATPGAVCPAHSGQPLAFACARCGAFACEQCRSGPERNLCPSCVARLAPSAVRVWQSVIDGLRVGARSFIGLLPVLLPCALLKAAVWYERDLFLPHGASTKAAWLARVALTIGLTAGGAAVDSVIGSFADGVKILRFHDVLGGRSRRTGQLVLATVRRYPALLMVLMLDNVSLSVLAMACCVPALLVTGFVSFNEQEVVLAGAGPWAALRSSYLLGKRFYWRLVLLGTVNLALTLGAIMGSTELVSALLEGWAYHRAVAKVANTIVDLPISLFTDAILIALYVRIRAADDASRQMAGQPGL